MSVTRWFNQITRIFKHKKLRTCGVAFSVITVYLTVFSTSTQPRDYYGIHQRRAVEGKIKESQDSSLFAKIKASLGVKTTKTRRNLIIVSHGRSGSTLAGDIFNHHPSVFYMYEPLQTAIRIRDSRKLNDTGYTNLVTEFLTSVFRCKFDNPEILKDIERYYRKPEHPRISRAIGSPPLCRYDMTDRRWNPRQCKPMTGKVLGDACKDNYNLTVLKTLMWRIPKQNIKTILSACSAEDTDCKVIFLVRDPRAMIPSSRTIGFFGEKRGNPVNALWETRLYSYEKCKQTEENLELVRKLPDSLRDRVKLLRYEDLATKPLKALGDIFKFAGLPVPESVRKWMYETTHSSRRACNRRIDGGPITCTKDDGWEGVNRWRKNVQPHDIAIIEHYCRHTMGLLGYKTVDMSYDLLSNTTIPLFTEDYEAKAWFQG